MSEENVELAYRFYDAFNRRDFDALLAFMDPEVEFAARFMEMEGDPYYRGHDGVREWWRTLLAVFPDFSVEVLEVRDLGDTGIAALRLRGHGADSGVPFDEAMWQTVKVRDGKVTWAHNFGSEAEALEVAGLRE
jgi:ketosteroid isomerase-like protein